MVKTDWEKQSILLYCIGKTLAATCNVAGHARTRRVHNYKSMTRMGCDKKNVEKLYSISLFQCKE